jgi:hypothetical protein
MSKKLKRTITGISITVGALLPLRPFFFTKPTDPTTETIDLILTPAFILGRALPPMGDSGETAFFITAILTNAILYGFVAHYICSKISSNLPGGQQD